MRGSACRLVAAILVLALPLSQLYVPNRGGVTAGEPPRPAPEQRTGTAAGRPHVVAGGGNRVLPSSLRARYPHTTAGQTSQARNTVRVDRPLFEPVNGFDPETSIELPDRRGRFEQTFANADGTRTTVFSTTPVNYQDGRGDWRPIHPTLRPDGDLLRAEGGATNAAFAKRMEPGKPVATLNIDARHLVGWTVRGAGPAGATTDGGTATYRSFARDADLELAAHATGVKETIVLRSANAPAAYTVDLALSGLTPRLAGNRVELVDAGGRVLADIPAGTMVDAAGARSDAVRYQLAGTALTVAADPMWLRDPRRAYPVRLDPSVQNLRGSAALTVRDGDAYPGGQDFQVGAKSGTKAAAYLAFFSVSTTLAHHRILGAQLSVANYDSASCRPRAVTVHPVTQSWSPGDTSLRYPGPSVGGALASKSYAHGHVAFGATHTNCPVKATLYNLGTAGRDLVQGWANGELNRGLSLRASVSDGLAWKRFAGTSTDNPPRLYLTHSPYNADYEIPNKVPDPLVLQNQDGKIKVTVTNKGAQDWTPATFYLAYRVFNADGLLVSQQVSAHLPGTVARGAKVTLDATIKRMAPGTYTLDFTMVRAGGPTFTDEQVPPGRLVLGVFNVPPVVTDTFPPNGYQAPTLTPELWATATDLDAPDSTLRYNFSICPDSGACTISGYQAASAWTVPAGVLRWGRAYTWHADVKDANGAVRPTPTLTVLTEVPQPAITGSIANAPYSSGEHDFDPKIGNFTTAAIDSPVTTSGPPLNIARTYNSLDPRTTGAFGAGWSTVYDMRVHPETDGSGNVVVTMPDGQQVRFGRNPDGTYQPPTARRSQLTFTAGQWALRDQGGTRYVFSGNGLLTQIQGPWGKPVTLTYGTDGKLAKATSQNSGRSLSFTWTGAQVTKVATNLAGNAWTYSYSGDALTKVCGPESTCATYGTSTGSHYRSAVLDSKPDSYWRLGETGGDTAASEVAVNLGKDGAAYHGVTHGAAGAIAGAGDTAVTLSGKGSFVELPKGLAKRSRDMAVELWFKTNSVRPNPLLGYQNKALGDTSTAGVPILYIGTDGKLRGQFATGATTPITSTSVVNNGQWHHVVLSAMGATQTLYLDGTQVGTLTATINQVTLTHAQAGAVYATGSWPAYGGTPRAYFTGTLDEVALYPHPLDAAAVAAHRRLGTGTAPLLSSVTLPSGKRAATVAYDVATDRVDEYTDEHGGLWRVGKPAVVGGDTDLRRTVLVRDPANAPYLYEYDALGGWLLRTGTPAGIAVRTEDDPPTTTPPPEQPNCPTPDPQDPTFCTWDISGGAGSGDPTFEIHDTDGMSVRAYRYDDFGQLTRVYNELGDYVDLGYDARGNLTARTTCRTSTTDCHTTRYTYPTGLTDPLDPRWDKPLEVRDPRSASPTDSTYRTAYTYTAQGDLLTRTNPDGGVARIAYSNGTEAAHGGGTVPSGLPLSTTDERNAVTRFAYYATGDLARVTEPSGLTITYAYDALGRRTQETEVSDAYPGGVVTTYSYDGLSRMTTLTGAVTTNALSGTRHQAETAWRYDPDGNMLAEQVSDLAGDDPARTTSFGYDDHNRLESVVDAEGGEHTFTYDESGNRTSTVDSAGNRIGLPWVSRSRVSRSHATTVVFSNSIGVSMPRLLWRRRRLWKISR